MTTKLVKDLNTYLKKVREQLEKERSIQLVMGNEASDLDSMVSSIMYSYFLSKETYDEKHPVAPLINIVRNDFKLRMEAVYLFRDIGIDNENFIFLDEIDLNKIKKKSQLKLVLVDHNKLSDAQASLGDQVYEIIDHHKDEELYSQVVRRTVEMVGSTATLIAERIYKSDPKMLDEGLSKLLVGTILLDTANLDEKAGRTSPKDKDMVEKLMKIAKVSQTDLFDKLEFEKFNGEVLESFDLLRKDYKGYTKADVKVGISSVPISIKKWAAKDKNLAKEFAAFSKAKKIDALLSLNYYKDPDFKRELIVFSPHKNLHDKLTSFLDNLKIGLTSITVDNLSSWKNGELSFFKDLELSRKILSAKLDDLATFQ